jgi:nondiscriminating glutamyl-tRNA synthetase
MAKITRYAPSPTGRIHLGQTKASFFPYAVAKKDGGKFILRIEDTDAKRNKPEAVEQLLEDLKWLGIDYDLGPENPNEKNEYFQSQRQEIYKKYIDQLLAEDKAYKAYDTTEERAEQIKLQRSKGQSPVFFGEKLSDEQEKKYESEGRLPVIRLKVPRNEIIVFEDKVFGKVSVSTNQIGDMVIQKSDGSPMYNFCVVIDDHLMGVTDVLRGFGHLSNTSKQVLLYKIFGWKAPNFAHFGDILNENVPGKLSKRHGAKPIAQYRAEGYLPDAMLNYVVTISCSFHFANKDEEIMSRDEFLSKIEVDKILKTNAKFNTQKLDWFNGQHIRQLSNEEFVKSVVTWLENHAKNLKDYDANFDTDLVDVFLSDKDKLERGLLLIKERVTKWSEIFSYLKFLFIKPVNTEIDHTPTKHSKEEFDLMVSKIYNEVNILSVPWTHAEWEQKIRALADQTGWKHGDVFMALRLRIVGSPFSPPLFESMEILGKQESLERLKD